LTIRRGRGDIRHGGCRPARENGDLLRSSSGTSPEEPDQASAENHRLAKQYRFLRVDRRTQW
jgi:hypothetical protein